MKSAIIKVVLLIFMFLLPISVSVGLIRKEAGKTVFIPTSAYTEYLAEYPAHRIEDLQLTVTEIKNTYEEIVNYKQPEDKPAPSLGTGAGDLIFGTDFGDRAFNWLNNLLSGTQKLSILVLKVSFDIVMIIFESIGWALGFIPYILRY